MSLFRTAHILSRVFLLLLLFIACVCVNKIEKRTRAKRERERKKWPKKGANPLLVAREKSEISKSKEIKKKQKEGTLYPNLNPKRARAPCTHRPNTKQRNNNNARVVLLLSDVVVVFVGVVVPRRRR
jgi:uncharacterized membrane protein YfcA